MRSPIRTACVVAVLVAAAMGTTATPAAEVVIPADLGRAGDWEAFQWNRAKGTIAVDQDFPPQAIIAAGSSGKSLKVAARFTSGKTFQFFQVLLPQPKVIDRDIVEARCWVHGSGTPHFLEFYFVTEGGQGVKVSPGPARLSFRGWKQVRARIPLDWPNRLRFKGVGIHNHKLRDAADVTVKLAQFELIPGKRERPKLPTLDKPIASKPRPTGPRRSRAKAPDRKGVPLVDAGPPLGRLRLIDEVICGDPADGHELAESAKGASRIETVLGRPCRVLPNAGGAKFFAVRVGKGKQLTAGVAYVLAVEYPEDRPRTMFVLNRGCETKRGFRTGAALGDVLYTYTNNNVSSLKVPLAGAYRTWRQFFFLQDRFPGLKGLRGAGPRPDLPKDGFWVVVAQSRADNAPLSAGAAVRGIRLFEVAEPDNLTVKLNLPPKPLPRRHLFWREEMSDGVIHSKAEGQRGVKHDTDWMEYKARLMLFLGMNTYAKDLLEFGHNQGWDSAVFGGSKWVNQAQAPTRWRDALAMLKDYPFDVLPYYEYAGSVGQFSLGRQRRCRTLAGGTTYTHITWSEKANADITDPDTLEDAKKVLYATIVRHAKAARFVGAWFRTRPSHIPISFSDRCLHLFAKGGRRVTREQLAKDEALRQRYYAWWFGKRRAFLMALRDYLRKEVDPAAVVLFTPEASESGRSLAGWDLKVVTDDAGTWGKLLVGPVHKKAKPIAQADVIAAESYRKALRAFRQTWDKWEWQHSIPPADPAGYTETDGVMMTYPFNRAYTVASPKAMAGFRTPTGLAMIRHYALNENVMDKLVGYFVADVERAGPYCMLGEARAMAGGDPRYIGYLASNRFNRGFPEYVRRFNRAFLALPALPSTVAKDACADPAIVVRLIRTKAHGTYAAVVNVGLRAKKDVAIRLPTGAASTDAATGETLTSKDGVVRLSFDPCELRALHVGR